MQQHETEYLTTRELAELLRIKERKVYDLAVSGAHKHGVAFLIVHNLRKADAIDDPVDMISGSTGLTCSMDGSLVLTRPRDEADAVLYISGRDIENDAPLSLKFDMATTHWEKVGIAVDTDMSLERRQIMAVLREAGMPLTARQVSARCRKATRRCASATFIQHATSEMHMQPQLPPSRARSIFMISLNSTP